MPQPQKVKAHEPCAAPHVQVLGSSFTAFVGAGLARVAASLAFGNFGEFVAFFLAIVADHLDHLGKVAGMLRIDRRQCRQRAADVDELQGSIRRRPCSCLSSYTCRDNAEAVIAGGVGFNGGFLESLVLRSDAYLILQQPFAQKPVTLKQPRRQFRPWQ